MSKIRVGVVRGGPSAEYGVSLESGATVLRELPDDIYTPQDILIGRDGAWHFGGVVHEPYSVLQHCDIIFNGLHGAYGEDGKIQQLLNVFGIPYTGSGALASALGIHKWMAKERLITEGIRTPMAAKVHQGDDLTSRVRELFLRFPLPSMVKPLTQGSSIGVSLVSSPTELRNAIEYAFTYAPAVLVEEYISGKEASCAVIKGFRGEEFYVLPPIEIVLPPQSDFFDYEAKYSGNTEFVCPGRFTQGEKIDLQKIALAVHRALHLGQYSRIDFIVSPRRGIYVLEANTLPDLTSESLFLHSLEAVGASTPQFLDHVLSVAREEK